MSAPRFRQHTDGQLVLHDRSPELILLLGGQSPPWWIIRGPVYDGYQRLTDAEVHGEGWSEAVLVRADPDQHVYLSTGCLHDHHGYCAATDGQAGAKHPAECKFCRAPCVCPCHQPPSGDSTMKPPGTQTVTLDVRLNLDPVQLAALTEMGLVPREVNTPEVRRAIAAALGHHLPEEADSSRALGAVYVVLDRASAGLPLDQPLTRETS